MEWKKLRRKIQVPAYIQFFISIVFWIAAGLGLYGTLPLAVYVFMGMLLVCNISIILSTFLLDKFYIVNLQENFKNLEHLNLKLRAQRHEYLNEMQVVYGLLELEEYEEAYRYLHPLYEDIARIGKALRTKKPAVNALLQAKMEYAQKQQITFFVEVSSDLAALSMEQWEVCRILGNLIDNAFTAVSGMDGEKKVHLCIQENEKQYLFIIYNNGPVIPENKRELIFKKGYSSKKEEGHRLGLWMVRKLAGQYRGTITVTSVPGKTEFDVTLPKKNDSCISKSDSCG